VSPLSHTGAHEGTARRPTTWLAAGGLTSVAAGSAPARVMHGAAALRRCQRAVATGLTQQAAKAPALQRRAGL
jgi:hypothetical protein